MLTFEEEIEKAMETFGGELEEAYGFLTPLFAAPERGVILYAAGRTCERIYKYLARKGVAITAVCDENKRGDFLDSGLTIFSPKELYRTYQNEWIVVCTFNYSVDAITQLCLHNIPEKNILRATFTSNLAYFSKEEFFQNSELYNTSTLMSWSMTTYRRASCSTS